MMKKIVKKLKIRSEKKIKWCQSVKKLGIKNRNISLGSKNIITPILFLKQNERYFFNFIIKNPVLSWNTKFPNKDIGILLSLD